MWIAIGSVLGCFFLVKGGNQSAFHWALVIGAANGTAVGFAVGPAAEKGAILLSGLFAGTPFYFLGASLLATFWMDARKQNRDIEPVELVLSAIFLAVAIAFSIAQGFRARSHMRRRERTTTAT